MKTVMICVDINQESVQLLEDHLKSWSWDNIDEVHLVHGFKLQVYTDAFYFTSYPMENQYGEVEKSVNQVLEILEKNIFGENPKIKVIKKCIISNSPKKSLSEYAQDCSIDEMIIGTRGKHGVEGFFSSSFAEYMVGHAPCQLKIIRH